MTGRSVVRELLPRAIRKMTRTIPGVLIPGDSVSDPFRSCRVVAYSQLHLLVRLYWVDLPTLVRVLHLRMWQYPKLFTTTEQRFPQSLVTLSKPPSLTVCGCATTYNWFWKGGGVMPSLPPPPCSYIRRGVISGRMRVTCPLAL